MLTNGTAKYPPPPQNRKCARSSNQLASTRRLFGCPEALSLRWEPSGWAVELRSSRAGPVSKSTELTLLTLARGDGADDRKRCAKLRFRQLREDAAGPFDDMTAMAWAVDPGGSENAKLVTVVALLRRCGRARIEAKTCCVWTGTV